MGCKIQEAAARCGDGDCAVWGGFYETGPQRLRATYLLSQVSPRSAKVHWGGGWGGGGELADSHIGSAQHSTATVN